MAPLWLVEFSWNVMAHGDAREWKWRGKRLLERVATTLALCPGTWSIHGLLADPHSLTASSRQNWLPRLFKWTRPFLWKTKSGFCLCAITFQTCSTTADAHTSAASSRMNWRFRWFKWTRPFCRYMKSGFCACAVSFQTQSSNTADNLPFRPKIFIWKLTSSALVFLI